MLEVRSTRGNVGRALYGAATIAAVLLCLGGYPAAGQPVQMKQDPENTFRPLRALLAISEQSVTPPSSCNLGLLPNKRGPQQIGDLIAVVLAYHGVGDSTLSGSCDRDGNADCIVSLKHVRKRKGYPDELQFTIFKFKIVDGKAQPASLGEISP